jgi:hypothetical protein
MVINIQTNIFVKKWITIKGWFKNTFFIHYLNTLSIYCILFLFWNTSISAFIFFKEIIMIAHMWIINILECIFVTTLTLLPIIFGLEIEYEPVILDENNVVELEL